MQPPALPAPHAPHLSPSAWRRVRGQLAERLRQGSFVRGVSVLFAATAAAQAISFAATPILTRLYDPASYGVLAVYAGLLTVLTAVACLRYDAAVPIARSEQEAVDLLGVGSVALLASLAAVTVASFALPAAVLQRVGLGLLVPYRVLVPLGFAAMGAYGLLNAYATRNGAFGVIARTRISQALTGPLAQVLLAGLGRSWTELRTVGLLAGQVIGQSAGLAALLRDAMHRRPPAPSWAGMGAAARRYRGFPLVSSWGVLIDMIGATLALYLLADLYYPPAVAGFLFLTDRIVARPLGLMGSSLGPVMLSAAGRDVHADPARLRRRVAGVGLLAAAMAAGWIGTVNIAASWLFPRLLGPHWAGVVPYIHATSVWFFFAVLARLLGPTLQVLERQALNALPQVGGPLLAAGAFVLCAHAGLSAPVAVFAYAACQGVAFAGVIAATFVCLARLPPPVATA